MKKYEIKLKPHQAKALLELVKEWQRRIAANKEIENIYLKK